MKFLHHCLVPFLLLASCAVAATKTTSAVAVSLKKQGQQAAKPPTKQKMLRERVQELEGTSTGPHALHRRLQGMDWSQVGLDIAGEGGNDDSGGAVAISKNGMVVAVGAMSNDGANGVDSGHVRVSAWSGTTWEQRGQDLDGEDAYDLSGYSVSLSEDGDVVAIGAVNNTGNGFESGHVRAYRWDGAAWYKLGADIDGDDAVDWSGYSVSLSDDGNVLAIGATRNAGANETNGEYPGHVRVYRLGTTDWDKLGGDVDGEADYDFSGVAVSLSGDGNVLAVGATQNAGANETNGEYPGHVRVWVWNGADWVKRGADIDGNAADGLFGLSVSLSDNGTVLVVGAPGGPGGEEDRRRRTSEVFTSSGYASVYRWNGTTWYQLGGDLEGDALGDLYGSSVSISGDGNTIAVGAPLHGSTSTGRVIVSTWDGTAWNQQGLDIEGGADDCLGQSISLSGDGKFFAVGAFGNSIENGNYTGVTRVFELGCPVGLELDGGGTCVIPDATPTGGNPGCTCNNPMSLGPMCSNCGVSGDPHFKTWTGVKYDFHGACDLVLLQKPDFHSGLGLHIHIRTKIEGRYSSVETAAVRIGQDTLQVQSAGDKTLHWINGVANAELPATLSGFPVEYTEVDKGRKKQRIYTITLDGGETIVVNTFKKLVQVLFKNVARDSFSGSVGLMGDFETGDKLARDGKTVVRTANKFGHEWQVRSSEPSLFHSSEAPQYPDKCVMPVPMSKATKRRRLSESEVGEEKAAEVCAHVVIGERDECIFDVLATGDIEMVDIYDTETAGVH